jgi:hypothetical protein
MTTYFEQFYPQATKAMIKELKNSPDEEIKQMMQRPQTIWATIKKNWHNIDFNPPFVSILEMTQHKVNKQQQPQPNELRNRNNPFQILHLKAKTFKAETTKEKIQTVLSIIQPLLQDEVEPTQILKAQDIAQNFTTNEINNMMTPAGFQVFTQELHAKPTKYKYGTQSHGSNIEYDYILRVFHTSAGRKADNGWLNRPGLVLFQYLSTLGTMLSSYKHTASLYPSPSKRETLPPIQLSKIAEESPGEELLGKYSYNSQHLDTGYIKLFEIYITSSYAELGTPPREQTIEGQEARNYTYSLQQNYFRIQKVKKTIHGCGAHLGGSKTCKN